MQTINRRTSSKALRPNQDLADKSTEQPREREREGGREREREDTVIYMCIPYSHYYISLDSNYCYRLIAAVAILWDAVDDFSHAFDSSARLALALLCSSVRFASVIPPGHFPLLPLLYLAPRPCQSSLCECTHVSNDPQMIPSLIPP